MDTINNLNLAIIALTNAGAALRIVYCAICMSSGEPHKVAQMKTRIKNILIVVAIANSIYGIHALALHYFGG